MDQIVWIVVGCVLFAGFVFGGFWVCDRAKFGRIGYVAFGAIVLFIIVFALIYIARNFGGEPPSHANILHSMN